MADVNTKYIRRVILEAENGKSMDELDFTLDFFVYTNRVQTMKKSELVRVSTEEGVLYYAVIDSQKLGRGNIRCRARIVDVEPRLSGMERPVVIVREVGIMIGGNHCCNVPSTHVCDCFEEGYNIKFEAVTDIPKQKEQGVMYGIINDNIQSYGDITEQMVFKLDTADTINNVTLNVRRSDKIIVLVNADNPSHAMKGNGFGGFVPFNTDILGANGEYTLSVEGVLYRIYGEMTLVSGKLNINII